MKPNVPEVEHPKKRGAQTGHEGHGRVHVKDLTQAPRVEVPSAYQQTCPDCGGRLLRKDIRRRVVKECQPLEVEDRVLELPVEECLRCQKTYATKAPSVWPKSQLGNQLLSTAMQMTFGHRVSTERVGEQLKIQPSVLWGSYHRIAKLFS